MTAALPLSRDVRIVRQHRSGLVALAKPAGLRSHPNRSGVDRGSLLSAAYDLNGECYHWAEPGTGRDRFFHLAHRLDAPTSGIIIGSTDDNLAAAAREEFRAGRVRKFYFAVVRSDGGNPMPGVWRDSLQKSSERGRMRTHVRRGAEVATTRVLDVTPGRLDSGCALLKLSLETGRTHQIRVQCAHRHHPVVGDRNYGNFRFNRRIAERSGYKRMFLHASELSFDFIFQETRIEFAAEVPRPSEFDELLSGR
jgi:tRNA pseudouridine65 synthase